MLWPPAQERQASYSRRPLNLPHIIMQDGLFAAIVPPDGDTSPIHLCDCASVGLVILPANAVAGLQSSGLCADHFLTNSTRFMSPWPV
jgi:hypothetical protein